MQNLPELKEIVEKIEVEKELLSIMPKNNAKNIDKYLEKIEQLKKEYEEYQNIITDILYKRYKKAINIKSTNDVKNLDIRLNTIESVLYLLSDTKTSYEKMELDKIIYKIGRYYKGNLENINVQIEAVIKKFDVVGIELGLTDFDYSVYVTQYMKVFLEEKRRGNVNSNKIKAKFEEVYWKCPDLIVHIELNIRYIYLKNQVQIDKYFEKERNNILKQWEKTPKQIMNSYFGIKRQKREQIAKDKKKLLESFLSREFDIKEYTEAKIQENYSKILSPKMIEDIEVNQEEVEKGVFEFLNSLYEYKNYLNFKFIIDDVKKYYQEKEKYKKSYEEIKKQILEKEKQLKKLNKKSSWQGIFRRNNKEIKQSAEQNRIILELKKMYKELDLNKFYNKIYTNLEENSTIFDVLNLANSYYNYLANCIIQNNKTITQEKIDEKINELESFLKNPYNNIINNLTISEEKDISMIIKDRYRLLNFNIEKEDFSIKSVDKLISTLENIERSLYLKSVGLKVDEIEEILKIRDSLKIK